MKRSANLLKLTVLSMLVALGVGHFSHFTGGGNVPHGSLYQHCLFRIFRSLVFAAVCNVDRHYSHGIHGIPPLALTGAIFGAFFFGVCYRLSKGKIIFAVIGEAIGTGVIGAIVSYPVMTFLWGKEGLSWLFYMPSFICGTLIGSSIAYVFLWKFASNGMLVKIQAKLGSRCYSTKSTTLSDAVSIVGIGAILFVVVELACDIFNLSGKLWELLPFAAPAGCALAAIVFYFTRKGKMSHD